MDIPLRVPATDKGASMVESKKSAMEVRLRRAARKRGMRLVKSRAREINIDNHGEYMLVDDRANTVIAGERYNATLEQLVDTIYAARPD